MAKTASKNKRRQAGGKTVKTTRLPKGPLSPTFLAVLTRVVITPKEIVHPDKVTSFQTGPMVWLIFNQTNSDQNVTIDPGSFVDANTNRPDNPLTTGDPISRLVPARKKLALIGIIRDDAHQISYRYEIGAQNQITRDIKTIDPDLDVVDPRP